MRPDPATLKRMFREGRQAEAIAACEAWCAREPGNAEALRLAGNMQLVARNFARAAEWLQALHEREPADGDALFNLGMCRRELRDVPAALAAFEAYTARFPGHPDGWVCRAECTLQANRPADALGHAERALRIDPANVPGWTVRGNAHVALGQAEQAAAAYTRAIALAPDLAELRVKRGDVFEAAGDCARAADDYRAALALVPEDDVTLKKATLCLLQLDRGDEGIALCREVLRRHPDSITARLGAEWLLAQQVPLWHVPMMNEEERNRPYQQALEAAVGPDTLVFEVGTGSGLLAMMAARAGARQVVTCEAVRLVAATAEEIVQANGLQDRIRVVAKPSYQVQVGQDLPARADVLVHEIFSSELLGEHVLPALEDAKARLLKPGGRILPGVASIMVALVGGEALGKELHVAQSFGFDLSAFNAIHPKKRPIHREDLPRVLLSDDVEAFRFDFHAQDRFPPERKHIAITATGDGRCWGVIQWIRFDFGDGIRFENHPAKPRPVASWQQTIYRFDAPRELRAGEVVTLAAMHDRSRPWFDLAD